MWIHLVLGMSYEPHGVLLMISSSSFLYVVETTWIVFVRGHVFISVCGDRNSKVGLDIFFEWLKGIWEVHPAMECGEN